MTIKFDLINAIQQMLPDHPVETRQLPLDDTVITIPSEKLVDVTLQLVNEFGFYHLSTITGIDTGSEIEVLYHFWNKSGLTLHLVLKYQNLQLETLTQLIPGALFYERELAEMFGITIVGLDNAPLLLPDDWDSSPPLLKGEL